MDLATLARIHRELDELAAHPRSARALATAWWQLVVLAPAYPAVYLQQGAWLLAAGDADGAAKLFAVAAEATGDPTFDLRRVDCLRELHGEDSARAALEALVASPRGADDVRGRWRLAVLELDRDRAPRRAAARLTEFLNGSPVRDDEDLRRKLPALLLLLECGRAGGWAERMEGQFAGVDAEVLAACAMDEPAERGGRLREALRGDPYHPWGRYALAAVAMAAGEPELARANLEVAVQGEPVLAWRARHDPAFAGLSLADLDPAAELPCEPWIRVEGEILPVRTGLEEAAQRAWWALPRAVRAVVQVTDAGLRVHAAGVMTAGYVQLYRGLRALAPFVRAGRMLVQEEGAGWIDALRFDGALSIRRDELPGDDAAAREAYLAARAEADPEDRWLKRLSGRELEDPLAALQAESERPGALVDALHKLGLALQAARRWDEAIAAYDRAIAGRPNASSGSKLNKGNVFAALRRWPEALACYDAAIAEAPRMAYAWGGRGQALRNLGRASEADAALHEAIKLDDKFSNPWLELAQLYFSDSLRAVALCDESLRRNPNCQYSWSTRGSALNNLRRWSEAHACYDRSIALDDNYWHPHYCRACSYALQGDREKALAAVKATLVRDPSKAKMLRGEADLLGLHRDPRFIALTREA